MNRLNKLFVALDKWQQKHPAVSFPIAINKKYSEDRSGNLAALLTYYGFLSIFPLLLVATTLIRILPIHNRVRIKLLTNLTHYVPLIGSDLQRNIHGLHHNGLDLAIVIVITIYGMRGVANVIQNTLNHLWLVPNKDRPGFPRNTLRSIGIVVVLGAGFILTAVLSTYAATLGRSIPVSIITSFLSFGILLGTLMLVFKIGIGGRGRTRKLFAGSLIAAIALQIIQIFGGLIVTRELTHLSSLYGLFAAVLGLVFWLYLISQVALYAIETTVVETLKLWPRSLHSAVHPTKADEKTLSGYQKRDML